MRALFSPDDSPNYVPLSRPGARRLLSPLRRRSLSRSLGRSLGRSISRSLSHSPSRSLSLPLAFALALLFTIACAKGPVELPLPATDAARDAEIAEIEGSIAADRQSLEDLVTQAKAEGQSELVLHEDASLREIAARLAASRRRLERIRQLEVPEETPAALP